MNIIPWVLENTEINQNDKCMVKLCTKMDYGQNNYCPQIIGQNAYFSQVVYVEIAHNNECTEVRNPRSNLQYDTQLS